MNRVCPRPDLDPQIEDLIYELKESITIVIVTHDMQQATRVSDRVGVMMMRADKSGELVEVGPAEQVFTRPKDPRTEAYITGRIG